jgi:glycosyltransferase involved in cell wall biosynthesis
MKLAFVHDFLIRFGGAERVLAELHAMYPDAPIYTIVADERLVAERFPNADIRTSFLGRVPGLSRRHRFALPAIPVAVESFDFREYDIVFSSSSGLSKGIVTRAKTLHISYCHTPPRYLWEDRERYLREEVPRFLAPLLLPMLHVVRLWDQHAAQRVDRFLANSRYTADRIARYYRRDAKVVPPPVDVSEHPCDIETRQRFALPEEFFLSVGRLVSWKRPELSVETFNRLDLPLIIVGSGPLERKLRRLARRNIRFLGFQPDTVVRKLMHAARALIQPQVEDFGIASVEAMAEGTPVIAFRKGGAVEIVEEGVTGEFFDDDEPIAFGDAVRRFRENDAKGRYDRKAIQVFARRYDASRFREAMSHELGFAS